MPFQKAKIFIFFRSLTAIYHEDRTTIFNSRSDSRKWKPVAFGWSTRLGSKLVFLLWDDHVCPAQIDPGQGDQVRTPAPLLTLYTPRWALMVSFTAYTGSENGISRPVPGLLFRNLLLKDPIYSDLWNEYVELESYFSDINSNMIYCLAHWYQVVI